MATIDDSVFIALVQLMTPYIDFEKEQRNYNLTSEFDALDDIHSAVYVTTSLYNEVEYVGSIARKDTLQNRLYSHYHKHPARRDLWRIIWVFPLQEDLADQQIRKLESFVYQYLGGSHMSKRIPRSSFTI